MSLWSRSLTIHKDQWSSADLTGRFPVRSVHGFEYVLVVAHRGYIHITPLRSRTSASYVSAFTSIVSFFKTLSHPLTHLLLDNETSSDLTTFFLSARVTYQYVPPNNHRTLPAERSIRTAKNHIISVLAACHISFPSNRWPDLLPQIELTLNTVRPWKPNPSVSAWHGLHSTPFDFASHPIHPPGQLVVAHDAPLTRASWAKHGTRGFYLSPAVHHYRCHNVFLPLPNSYRVCQTLDHFPDPLFSFEDSSSPPTQNPTFIDYNVLDQDIPDPPSPKPNSISSPNPNTDPNPNPSVSPPVSPGTAGVPPATFPPIGPSPPPYPIPQDGPQSIAGRTRSREAPPSPTPSDPQQPLPAHPAPSSPTSVPTPFVRGERYERTPHPLVDSPHENAHWGRDCGDSPPHFPPPPAPLTHGAGRVEGNPSPPTLPPLHPPPSPHPNHLVGRLVRMKFGHRWYRGVVTDHDVSTEAELIWHVRFEDGDECDLNLVELLPVLLPETHLSPPSVSPNQAPFISSPSPSNSLSSVSNFHLPSPFLPNHLSPSVVFPHLPQTPPVPTSSYPPSPNPAFPPTSSTKYPLTPQISKNSPLPIGPSENFCPLFFSALFSASPVPKANPFQSLTLEPFPTDLTHNTLFISPFDLTIPHDTPSLATPLSPSLAHSSNFLATRSASLFGFALPSLSLSPTSGEMVRVVGGGGGGGRRGKFFEVFPRLSHSLTNVQVSRVSLRLSLWFRSTLSPLHTLTQHTRVLLRFPFWFRSSISLSLRLFSGCPPPLSSSSLTSGPTLHRKMVSTIHHFPFFLLLSSRLESEPFRLSPHFPLCCVWPPPGAVVAGKRQRAY